VFRRVWLDLVVASRAPDDQADFGGRRVSERHHGAGIIGSVRRGGGGGSGGLLGRARHRQYVVVRIAPVHPTWDTRITLAVPDAGGNEQDRPTRPRRCLGRDVAVFARHRPGHVAQLLLRRNRRSESILQKLA
jgi:hypothetical protein